MSVREIDWERLERFVRGEGSLEEQASNERWVQERPERSVMAAAMRSIGRPPNTPVVEWDEQAIWQRIRRRMPWYAESARLARMSASTKGRRGSRAFAQRIAVPALSRMSSIAAAIIVIGGAALLFGRGREASPSIAQHAGGAAHEIKTVPGQRAVLDLSDGTRVTLGPDSRLRIPAAFRSPTGPREVELTGQGHFTVRHDSTRPFRVRTRAGVAEDLGTAFVVTAHAETRGMQVVVTEGLVALRRSGALSTALPLVTLARGSLGTLDESGTATVATVDDLSDFTAWTRGEVRFEGTPLREALPVLARWYGVNIHLAERSLATRRITASFTDKSADEVLDALSLLLDLRVHRGAKSITLYAR